MNRVVVTGLGAICPVGHSPSDLFAALVAGRSGISVIDGATSGQAPLVAGQVVFDPAPHWPPHQTAQYDRVTQFALVSAAQAISDAGLVLSEEESLRAGIYWGTGMGGAGTIEESYRMFYAVPQRLRPTTVVLGMSNAAAAHVSIQNGLRGPLLNVSTACSSSAAALGEAYRAIQAGRAEVIVTGGSEALLTPGVLAAWDAMRAVAHADPADASRSCKPFDAKRTGLVLGEGGAALVLESEEHALRRGARIRAEFVGYGNASDAIAISKPDSGGQVRAMREALADARLAPDAIDYVNAHGTATPIGDVVETHALKTAFGSHAASLCVSSTKALHGHLMGATGALEFLISLLALEQGVVPPTAHLDHPDPECDLDYVTHEARQIPVRAVMSNSFGFGGTNVVLIARKYEA
jgi:3-oxoacyl-[acyl-carrier-protein] synthase II